MENIKGEGRLETKILGTLQLDHYIRGMLVFTEFKIFYLAVSCLKT
jgi:hypothetical protein